jgi:ribonuclease E
MAPEPKVAASRRRRTAAAAETAETADTTDTTEPTAPETTPDETAAAPARRTRTRASARTLDGALSGVSSPAGPLNPFAPAVVAPRETETEPETEAEAAPPAPRPRTRRRTPAVDLTFQAPPPPAPEVDLAAIDDELAEDDPDEPADGIEEAGEGTVRRRRRGRRGRGRGRTGEGDGQDGEASEPAATDGEPDPTDDDDDHEDAAEGEGQSRSSRRRRRRRRRGGEGTDPEPDDPPNTVVRVREPRPRRNDNDNVRGLTGSTRLEAKRQRRRDGRESGRRRVPIITEAEFLARRESVERVMVVRGTKDRTQIAVLEDGVLVEHYVARASAAATVNNVYLGKVNNVLPSMEAAFVDIGKGRNAVLYAGEVNYDASTLEGRPRKIEQALKSGQALLAQVTKDPVGHKGARLTSQISLPGRYLVYVPEGSMTGISRKLPEQERNRLKAILKDIVPEHAGVIIRTAAEGASEEELTRDVNRLEAQWQDIQRKAATATAPALLYAEPDLAIRVVRDIFNEDFATLVVSGDDEWDTLSSYVEFVAPDLAPRLTRWTEERDVFAAYRVDEQLAKALDRKVHLPSGGSLVIDRTEAMTVIDVNTGRFTGKGGNLEETVTKNNLEAAEEIVRQLRVRDVGGIIVIDFIDMVLESNRDLVLRRLTECLGRDRTRHQVAEVTSLGLVQMTRKRVGGGLIEAYSETCPHCNGRGVLIHLDPVPAPVEDQDPPADAVVEAEETRQIS